MFDACRAFAASVLVQLGARHNRRVTMNGDVIEHLHRYHWPGIVRELSTQRPGK